MNSPSSGIPSSGARPLVLIIDDNEQVRLFLHAVLERNGFEVMEAENGRQGIRAVASRVPAVVLCDMFMPEQDGIETLRDLKRVAPGIPFVAMSGGGSDMPLDVLPIAAMLGAARILRKPLSGDVVVEALTDAIRRSGTAGAHA